MFKKPVRNLQDKIEKRSVEVTDQTNLTELQGAN